MANKFSRNPSVTQGQNTMDSYYLYVVQICFCKHLRIDRTGEMINPYRNRADYIRIFFANKQMSGAYVK